LTLLPNQYISIIVPVLNEESHIRDFLNTLQCYRKSGHEIIIVDGGSIDNTYNFCKQHVDQLLISNAGRAIQMNLGAKHAKNNILLFLHSDTILPDNADALIIKSLTNIYHWGRFDIKLSGKQFIFQIIEKMINIRSRYTKIATGDQAIFIYKAIFNDINGYPEIELMEDIAISKLLRKRYPCKCVTEKVITSSRRWENNGIIKTIFLMWTLRLLFFIGAKPSQLFRFYYENK